MSFLYVKQKTAYEVRISDWSSDVCSSDLVNDERAEELISTGASRVATACPFCYIMLDDGVKGAGAEETVQVADISMHLLEALEAGDADRARQLTTLED